MRCRSRLAVGFVCFMLVQIAPGDPINAIVPPDAPADVVEQVAQDYGLDKPLLVQFGLWLSKVVVRAISAVRWRRAGRSGPTCIPPSATR